MERETGIEPATSSLGSWRSTAELLPLAVQLLFGQAKFSIRGRGRQCAGRLKPLLGLFVGDPARLKARALSRLLD